MNQLISFDQLAQLSAAALIVAALGIMYLIIKAGSEGFDKMSTRFAEGLTNGNNQAYEAMTEAVRTLKDATEGQRLFFSAQISDLRKEFDEAMGEARERIKELETENEAKDREINELKQKNAELEAQITRLKAQVDKGTPTKPKARKGKDAQKTIGAGARIAGD